jgi:hypothetical protein
MPSAVKILRHETHRSRSSLLIVTPVKPEDKYYSSFLRDFGFDLQIRLLFLHLVFFLYQLKIYALFYGSETQLISTQFWTVKVKHCKHYWMYILRLYTVEMRCLTVNIAYSVSEVFLHFNTPKSITEEYLQYICLYLLTYQQRMR